MKIAKITAAFALGCLPIIQAQTTNSQPRFEVAAIRTFSEPVRTGLRGGPGTEDPTHIYWIVSRDALILRAYNLEPDQISPDWHTLLSPIYQVVATVPEGATQEQFCQMLQNLLAERFHLVVHQENKSVRAYNLVIAKGGPKLKVSEDVSPPKPTHAPGQHNLAAPVSMTGRDGQWTIVGRAATIADLVKGLRFAVQARIFDETGLTDKYDFTVPYSVNSDEPGSLATDAVRDKLGLHLEPTTISLPIVFIDHFDKVPTEN